MLASLVEDFPVCDSPLTCRILHIAVVTYCTITIWNVRTNQYIGKRGLNLRYILPSAVL